MIMLKGGVVLLVLTLAAIDALPYIQAKRTPQYSHASTYGHIYKRHDVGLTRRLMEAHELVRRVGTECSLGDIVNDYYNVLLQEAKEVVVGGWDEFMDLCSLHMDQLYQNVKESVESGDESNCNCFLGRYRDVGPLLNDKEAYRDYSCNMMVTRFGKTCTDQAIVNCSQIVRQVNDAVNQNPLPEDIQTLINQGIDCLTELLPSQPQWTKECDNLMPPVPPAQYIGAVHTFWTMQTKGCKIKVLLRDCIPPFQYICVLNEADRRKVFEDAVDCYNQHNANAIGQCELAEHSQIRESLIEYLVADYQTHCDDLTILEAFWARTGCTNIPPWRPESVGYTTPDYAEWNQSKQKKSSNDLTELLDLMKRVLGKTTQN